MNIIHNSHLDQLDGGLSALHVHCLGHVPALGQLAGDGVQGAGPLVQLRIDQ